MSGLSDKTYSCGGEGSLSGGGGDESAFLGFSVVLGLTLEKNFRIPPFFFSWRSLSSSEGTEESSEESSDIMMLMLWCDQEVVVERARLWRRRG